MIYKMKFRASFKSVLLPCVVAIALILGIHVSASAEPAKSKEAAAATRKANDKLYKSLPFADKQDFEFANRGFIGRPKSLIIKDAKGNVVWDMESYSVPVHGQKTLEV